MSIKVYDTAVCGFVMTDTAAEAIAKMASYTKLGTRAECCGLTFTPSYNPDRHGPQIHRWHGLIEHRQSAHGEETDMNALQAAAAVAVVATVTPEPEIDVQHVAEPKPLQDHAMSDEPEEPDA